LKSRIRRQPFFLANWCKIAPKINLKKIILFQILNFFVKFDVTLKKSSSDLDMFLVLRFSPWVWQKLGALKKLRWAWNKGKKCSAKLGNAPILVFPWVSPCLYFVFLPCALTVGFSSPMCLDRVAVSFWRLLRIRNVSQAMSVRTIVSVKCRVYEWAMVIVSEKCFQLQMWRFKLQVWGVEFLSEQVWKSWMNGLGLEFLMRGQSNKMN
jgi:hypothetical protein